jgi:hypothetical protein
VSADACASKVQYAEALIKRLGLPDSRDTRVSLVAWMVKESGANEGITGAANNPLNSTRNDKGATDFNSVHVKNYASCESGVRSHACRLPLTNGATEGRPVDQER